MPVQRGVGDRSMLFIDGSSFHSAAKSLGAAIDYKSLLDYFSSVAPVLRANYYVALSVDAEFDTLRPLVDWLDYNGFNVVAKPLKESVSEDGHVRRRGTLDVRIAVDMMRADRVSEIVLFSGSGDLVDAVEAVQSKGARVTVVSVKSMISDELRRQADHFLELPTIIADISRRPRAPVDEPTEAPVERAAAKRARAVGSIRAA